MENRAGQELFSVALKAGLSLFYVITKGRAATFSRGVNYSEKSVRRFLGLENPGNFSWDSGIFSLKFKGFWDFFQLIFSKYFPLFFFAELFPKFFATYNPSNYF